MNINPTSHSTTFNPSIDNTTAKPASFKQTSWKERIQTTFSKLHEELSARFIKLKSRITKTAIKDKHATLTEKVSETLQVNDIKLTSVDAVEPIDLLPSDPNLLLKKLPNGISYYVKKNAHPYPEKAYISLIVKTGYLNETDDEFGIAQLVHNCALRETENFGLNEIKNYFSSKGLEWGKNITTQLSSGHTAYHINFPIQDNEIIEKIFAILSDVAFKATLTDSLIDLEREIVHSKLLQSRSVKSNYQQSFYPSLIVGTDHEKIYDLKAEALNVKACPALTIRAFYKKWYKPENMAIIAIGDFKDDKTIGDSIEKHFGKITGPTSQPIEKAIKKFTPATKPHFTCFSDTEITASQAEIYYLLPPDNNKQRTLKDCKAILINDIINQACVNRMSEITEQANSPFIMASARKTNTTPGNPCFRAAMTVKEGELQRGFKEMLIELKRLKMHGITANEFERIKEGLAITLDHRIQEGDKSTPSELKEWYKLHFLKRSTLATSSELIQTMLSLLKEIKLEEVNKQVAYLLHHDNCIAGTIEPRKEGLTPINKTDLAQIVEEVKKIPVTPYVSTNITKALLDHVPVAGKIVETISHPKSGVTEYKLENGVKVYFKPTTFQNDYVSIQAISSRGLQSAFFKDRVSALLTEDFFDECGLGNLSNAEIYKVLNGKNVNFQSEIRDFTTTMNTISVRRDLETAFQLIYLMFTNPGYSKEAFESALSKAKERLKNITNNPRAQFADINLRLQTQGHSAFKSLHFDDLKDANYETCKSFHQTLHSNPSDFTFTIVGNASDEQVREYITKYLAGLPTLQITSTPVLYPVVPFPSGIVREEIRGNQGFGTSCITFPTAVTDDFQEKILSQFCSRLVKARMQKNLSEKSMVSCSFLKPAWPEISKTIPTKVAVTFMGDESDIKQIEGNLLKVLAEFQTNGPTAEEIASARQKMERDIEESLQSNSGWIAVISGLTNWGRSVDSFEDRKVVHDSMTSEMLKEHFKKIFPLGNYTIATLLPKVADTKSTTLQVADK